MNWTALAPARRNFIKWIDILQPTFKNRNIQCSLWNSCENLEVVDSKNFSNSLKCISTTDSIHENIKQICLIPLTILIIAINVCVLLVIAVNKKFHNTTYMLIAALGFADLCVGFVSIGTLVTRASEKTLDLCLVRIGFTIAACIDSLLVLMLIAIDRYIAVFKGLRYIQIVKRERVIFGIILVSIISIAVGFLPLMGWRVSTYNKYCSFLYVVPANYIIVLFSSCVFIPITAMFVIYGRLYKNAQIHIKRIESIENITQPRLSNGQLRISARTAKSLKTLTVVFGCVLLTWMPFLITSIAQIICEDKTCFLKEIVGTHLLILGFSNSFLNPVIYALGTKDFRETFVHTCFGRFPCFNQRQSRSRSNIYPVLSRTRL
ncbi:G protein-coupled receptor 119 [Mytilus galloprovincialis]|uniref:G protein-coupled receptor 119 n=1 Tax=Mytilus galloprovincialis TaxID=29158 RepID=A0A8B6C856_MYTGA|nr:G protein-coupled receptor 119 [Mytilus galloprovincialis]